MRLPRLFSLGLMLGLVLTLSACGGKDEKKDETTDAKKDAKQTAKKDAKPTAKKDDADKGGTATKKASEKLIGKWEFDSVATLTKMEGEANTDEEKQALEFVKGMMSEMKMSFEFTKDGKMIMSMAAEEANETKEGTYTVKSESESSLVLSGTIDGDTKDVKANLISDDQLELVMPEGEGPGSMVLKRAK